MQRTQRAEASLGNRARCPRLLPAVCAIVDVRVCVSGSQLDCAATKLRSVVNCGHRGAAPKAAGSRSTACLQIRALHLRVRAAERKAATAQRPRQSVERASSLQRSGSCAHVHAHPAQRMAEDADPCAELRRSAIPQDASARGDRPSASSETRLQDGLLQASTAKLAAVADEGQVHVRRSVCIASAFALVRSTSHPEVLHLTHAQVRLVPSPRTRPCALIAAVACWLRPACVRQA